MMYKLSLRLCCSAAVIDVWTFCFFFFNEEATCCINFRHLLIWTIQEVEKTQNRILRISYLFILLFSQPTKITTLKYYSCTGSSTHVHMCWSSCSAVPFYGIIFYMLDDILWPCPMQIWKITELLNNVCCHNLYAWNSEVYIWK